MTQPVAQRIPETSERARVAVPPPQRFDPVAALARAAAPAEGATCRLGDASCASAHAGLVARQRAAGSSLLQRSLLDLQRQYGNRHVTLVLRAAEGAEPAGDLDAVESSIGQARGAGAHMDPGTRTRMEQAFGADFTGVRVHADARADDLSRAIGARAFTTGKDVFFRQGEYDPGSSSGRELLAHELTHVVQQTGDGVHPKMTVSQPGDPQELEAERMARDVVAAEHAQRQPEAESEEDKRHRHA